jgi:hypothetical protein
MHHMALGESIGYSTRLSQNNYSLYTPANSGASGIHVNLMGDPSLRSDYIWQPQNLVVTPVTGAGANLSWTPSPDAGVVGYYVYRSDSTWGTYSRISGLLTTAAFTDNKGVNGKKFYLVRPAKLQQTPSGAYYNLGIGIVDSASVSYPLTIAGLSASRQVALFPNPAAGRLNALIEASLNEPATLVLANATGAVLHTQSTSLHPGENTISWDISAWPAGLYTFTLHSKSGSLVRKWVKVDAR